MTRIKNIPGVKGLRVLVVDDDPDTCWMLKLLLGMYEVEVIAASSADVALSNLSESELDVLICDIAMPVKDGFWLIEQVRALSPEQGGKVPAIALTAYCDQETQTRALAAGFQAFMTKPFELNKILDSILTLLSARSFSLVGLDFGC